MQMHDLTEKIKDYMHDVLNNMSLLHAYKSVGHYDFVVGFSDKPRHKVGLLLHPNGRAVDIYYQDAFVKIYLYPMPLNSVSDLDYALRSIAEHTIFECKQTLIKEITGLEIVDYKQRRLVGRGFPACH